MRPSYIFSGLFAASLLALTLPLHADDTLEQGFKKPPVSARPHTWWHWVNGNVSLKGITADLKAMKRVGIGGAQIFNVDVGIPAGKTPFLSPQWRAAIKHAAEEANRLGLELCIHNGAGWSSSGGPWITPEHAMQALTWSETPVHGPMHFDGTLPQPPIRAGYYRDVAVYAFRKPAGETEGKALRIGGISAKAGFERGDRIAPDASPTPDGMATARDGVILVSETPDASGKVTWDAPEGDWILIRMGHTPTGAENEPAPVSGRGLECDKLSREAMDAHWTGMMGVVLKDLGPLAGQTLNNALIDSYEVGSQNWTPRFREEFRRLRGYDPLPFLPVVTGRVIGSVEVSERFLWDFRRTICDLFAANYYGYFRELCRKNGLKASFEPYGNGSFDNLQIGGLADIPMGEFWVGGGTVETTKLASSAGHVNGKPIIGAESFTADEGRGRWLVEPYAIKTLGDRIFSLGVNRYIFHRYAHQPWLDLKPGMTMGPWGTHFERTVTWWDQSAAWLQYVARCQYLLQTGRFVADVLYFAGDDGPNDLPWLRGQVVPNGYDYDGCDATVLQSLRVEDGQLVLPSGMRYRVLMLPDSRWMTPATLQKLRELVQAGATILGPKPRQSPSLSDYPACDATVQRIADAVWGDADGQAAAEHAYGRGRVIWGRPIAEVLAAQSVLPDVAVTDPTLHPLAWIHRTTGSADYYFVSNQRYHPDTVEIAFRMVGKRPELWHPETGVTEAAPIWHEEAGRTFVTLRLTSAESVFVVFRQLAAGDHVVAIMRQGEQSALPAPRLEIRQAFYEAVDGAGKADVTAQVAALVTSGETMIPATNAEFGDPTPQHVKRLRVVYMLDGKPMEKSVDENDTLDLGGNVAPTRPEYETLSSHNVPMLRAWTPGVYDVRFASGATAHVHADANQTLPIEGTWTLRFPPHLGAPAQITLNRLASWTEQTDPGVRYFSGSATYTTNFDAPDRLFASGHALILDLGNVKNFAEVWVNGKQLATLWKPPFRLEVGEYVHPGQNSLTVRVTNLWPNRLIGDEQFPEEVEWNGDTIKAWPQWLLDGKPRPKTDRITFATWRFWHKNDTPLESGLLGPVALVAVPQIPLSPHGAQPK